MTTRSIGAHLALFTAALVLALIAWTSEDQPARKHVEAELWSGSVQAVERIELSNDKQNVIIEPRTDAAGRYFVGTIEPVEAPKGSQEPAPDAGAPATPSEDPHAGHGHGEHDDDDHGHGSSPKASDTPKKPRRFISLDKGTELVESLAALKASRVLGKVEGERAAQYGLDKSDKGTLKVVIGGRDYQLLLGDKTPGGNDRYVKRPDTGDGYVIAGGIVDDLMSAENRLLEREFHDFETSEVAKVVIRKGDQSREVVRFAGEKDFWAAPDSPQTKDETVSNWMTKLGRLRVTTYLDEREPQPKPEEQVMVVEYYNERGKQIGQLELYRRAPENATERPDYLAKSEQSRWFATVLRSTAEQLDQDLGSVLAR